jgi:hypothetical protein
MIYLSITLSDSLADVNRCTGNSTAKDLQLHVESCSPKHSNASSTDAC